MSLFATKSIDKIRAEASATGEHSLKRVLGPLDLTSLGIGAVIGTGIFVLTGQAAEAHAGPAIVLSMVLVTKQRSPAPVTAETIDGAGETVFEHAEEIGAIL